MISGTLNMMPLLSVFLAIFYAIIPIASAGERLNSPFEADRQEQDRHREASQRRDLAVSDQDDAGYFSCSEGDTLPGYDFIDISSSGTSIGFMGADELFESGLPIGFDFPFYSRTYDEFTVDSNGAIYFSSNFLGSTNVCPLPTRQSNSVQRFIAVYHDDLVVQDDGDIYYETFDTCPIAANLGACLVVQFQHMCRYPCDVEEFMIFEAILFSSGDIYFQYELASPGNGLGATAGIQGSANTSPVQGINYSCNEDALFGGLAIGFQPTTDADGVCDTATTCGTTVLPPNSCGAFKCCDPSTNAAGPACCGTTPYDPTKSTCCFNLVLPGIVDDCSNAPSLAPSSKPSSAPSISPSTTPSTTPSTLPSNAPSSHPSHFPSTMPSPQDEACSDQSTNICDYRLDGGFVDSTFTSVCTAHEKGGEIHYHNECIQTTLIEGLGVGDRESQSGREIVGCGCCPDDGTKVKDPKGGAPWCEGGLDCFGEVLDNLCHVAKSGKKGANKFYVCVVDRSTGTATTECEENFFVPKDELDYVESCGMC